MHRMSPNRVVTKAELNDAFFSVKTLAIIYTSNATNPHINNRIPTSTKKPKKPRGKYLIN